MIKVCELCGKEFETKYPRQRYCKGPHYMRCHNCGNMFQIDGRISYCMEHKDTICCSKSCGLSYAFHNTPKDKIQNRVKKSKETKRQRYGDENYNNIDKARQTNRERYGTDNPLSSKTVRDKIRETNLQRYGVENAMSSKEVKSKFRQTMIQKYGTDNPAKAESSKERMRQTNRERYGADWQFQSENFKEKSKETNIQRYGIEHPLSSDVVKKHTVENNTERYGVPHHRSLKEVKPKVPETYRKKSLISTGYYLLNKTLEERKHQMDRAQMSKFERRILDTLKQYNIEFQQHYVLTDGEETHAFDFYLPKYKILIDADGLYWHRYLCDEGYNNTYGMSDETHLSLIPKDHIFIVIVEGQEEKSIKELHTTLKKIDRNIFDYDSDLFKWCRSIDFPYPNYTKEKMYKDWDSLCRCERSTYSPGARMGISIIDQFHKSIFDCHVRGDISVKEAWYDDTRLKSVIENRLIYKNDVDPYKIMKGFHIAKKCIMVSKFNPVLAKYLVRKYLDEFDSVFDPFSGFSGRLLGVVSCGKTYEGHDINTRAIEESNQIIKFLNIGDRGSVSYGDALTSSGNHECLLTCPPYGTKEVYSTESEFRICDEWIDVCLRNFSCKRYVFVVDETERYKDNVTDYIENKSHLGKNSEKVVVIEN